MTAALGHPPAAALFLRSPYYRFRRLRSANKSAAVPTSFRIADGLRD
jgi:hypothetical protein